MELIFKLKNNEPIMLRADSLNYELCKIRQRKDEVTGITENEWAAFKWYASLPQALSRLMEMKLRASDATTLVQLREDLESARHEIMAGWSTGIDVRRKLGGKP